MQSSLGAHEIVKAGGSLVGHSVGEAAVLKRGGVAGRYKMAPVRNCCTLARTVHCQGRPGGSERLWPAPAACVQSWRGGFLSPSWCTALAETHHGKKQQEHVPRMPLRTAHWPLCLLLSTHPHTAFAYSPAIHPDFPESQASHTVPYTDCKQTKPSPRKVTEIKCVIVLRDTLIVY